MIFFKCSHFLTILIRNLIFGGPKAAKAVLQTALLGLGTPVSCQKNRVLKKPMIGLGIVFSDIGLKSLSLLLETKKNYALFANVLCFPIYS